MANVFNILDSVIIDSDSIINGSAENGTTVISSGIIAIDVPLPISTIVISTEGGSGVPDDLDTINGGVLGQVIIFKSASSSQDITFKDGTGNLRLAGDFATTRAEDSITLLFEAGNLWYEVSRANNG